MMRRRDLLIDIISYFTQAKLLKNLPLLRVRLKNLTPLFDRMIQISLFVVFSNHSVQGDISTIASYTVISEFGYIRSKYSP